MNLSIKELETLKECITCKCTAIETGLSSEPESKISLLDLWIKLENEKQDILFEENKIT